MKSYSCKQAEPVELSSWLEYGMWFYVIWLWLCHPRFHPLPWFRVPSAHPFLGIPTDPTELFWSFLLPGWWGKKKKTTGCNPVHKNSLIELSKLLLCRLSSVFVLKFPNRKERTWGPVHMSLSCSDEPVCSGSLLQNKLGIFVLCKGTVTQAYLPLSRLWFISFRIRGETNRKQK